MSDSFSDEEKNSNFSPDSNLNSSLTSEITSSENSDSFTQKPNENVDISNQSLNLNFLLIPFLEQSTSSFRCTASKPSSHSALHP